MGKGHGDRLTMGHTQPFAYGKAPTPAPLFKVAVFCSCSDQVLCILSRQNDVAAVGLYHGSSILPHMYMQLADQQDSSMAY